MTKLNPERPILKLIDNNKKVRKFTNKSPNNSTESQLIRALKLVNESGGMLYFDRDGKARSKKVKR